MTILTTKHLKQKIRPSLEKAHILPLVHYVKAKYYRLLGNNRLIRVPLDHLRCQEKPFSELQGFSGKPIADFPPCQFLQLSLTDPKKALDAFEQWLRKCLIDYKAFQVPTAEGGWANSVLVRDILRAHQEQSIILKDFEHANPILIDAVISRHAKQYFSVFNSIKENGYNKLLYPPIYCFPRGDHYVIENGHHRVSSLWVLGHEQAYVMVMRDEP